MSDVQRAAPAPTTVTDVRAIPLTRVTAATADSLKRIVPPKDSNRVPVAAFNASL